MSGLDNCTAFVVPSEWALFLKPATALPCPETLTFAHGAWNPYPKHYLCSS